MTIPYPIPSQRIMPSCCQSVKWALDNDYQSVSHYDHPLVVFQVRQPDDLPSIDACFSINILFVSKCLTKFQRLINKTVTFSFLYLFLFLKGRYNTFVYARIICGYFTIKCTSRYFIRLILSFRLKMQLVKKV